MIQDLQDTLAAHREGCVGMAANMIGYRKRSIIAQIVQHEMDHLDGIII